MPALRSKQKFGVAAGTLSKKSSAAHAASDGSADPGEYPKSQRCLPEAKTRSQLEATLPDEDEEREPSARTRSARGMQNRP